MSLSVCRTGSDSHPCSVTCPTVGVFLKGERNCQRHAPTAAQDKPQPATVSKLGQILHLSKVVPCACGNMISLMCFPFQFLSAPFHLKIFPMVLFCVALWLLRVSRRRAVSCSVTKVMSTPFLSPASCVIPRRKTGLMMLHCLMPAKVKATHTHCPIYLLKHSQFVAVCPLGICLSMKSCCSNYSLSVCTEQLSVCDVHQSLRFCRQCRCPYSWSCPWLRVSRVAAARVLSYRLLCCETWELQASAVYRYNPVC